jgi:hypothetical protein
VADPDDPQPDQGEAEAEPTHEPEATQEPEATHEPEFESDLDAAPDADEKREKAIRFAQIGLVVVALLVVAIVVIAKSGDDKSSNTDETGQTASDDSSGKPAGKPAWPHNVGGRPSALGTRGQPATAVTPSPTAKPGVYLWNDFDGWHLWVVNGAGVPAITGTLSSDDTVAKAVLAVPEAGTVSVDGQVVSFTLPTDKPLTGIDFNPGFFAKQLVFTLNGPDGSIPSTLVHVGTKADPAPFPLVLTKAPGN